MASLCWTCFAGTRKRCQAKLLLQGCGHKGAPASGAAILTPLLVSCCGGGRAGDVATALRIARVATIARGMCMAAKCSRLCGA